MTYKGRLTVPAKQLEIVSEKNVSETRLTDLPFPNHAADKFYIDCIRCTMYTMYNSITKLTFGWAGHCARTLLSPNYDS